MEAKGFFYLNSVKFPDLQCNNVHVHNTSMPIHAEYTSYVVPAWQSNWNCPYVDSLSRSVKWIMPSPAQDTICWCKLPGTSNIKCSLLTLMDFQHIVSVLTWITFIISCLLPLLLCSNLNCDWIRWVISLWRKVTFGKCTCSTVLIQSIPWFLGQIFVHQFYLDSQQHGQCNVM